LEEDPEYNSFMTQVDKYRKDHLAETINRGCDTDIQDLEAIMGSEALSGLPKTVKQQIEKPSPEGMKRKGGARHRGPRPAVEPTGDIKLRLGRANEAFQDNKIDEARVMVDEIIRINAETYEAWTLLSSIFQERKQVNDALMALIVAAHLRPKYVEAWFNCGEYALDSMGEHTDKILRDAQFCYANAVRHVPSSLEARRRKAYVLMLRENYNQAASEYKYILKACPHDLAVIRQLAVLYIDLGEAATGRDLYRETFEYFRMSPEEHELEITWNDVDSYAVLYSFLNQNETALRELKSLARWLLGRQEEGFWDEVTDNDCEWDMYDSRKAGVPHYMPGKFPVSSYGYGLPIELRVNLGKFRMNLGHYDEAMVRKFLISAFLLTQL
jgi:general transcription factor 3C polypeptide 3 (transcription factor C subunit 4)